jgi:hypothetical protein
LYTSLSIIIIADEGVFVKRFLGKIFFYFLSKFCLTKVLEVWYNRNSVCGDRSQTATLLLGEKIRGRAKTQTAIKFI